MINEIVAQGTWEEKILTLTPGYDQSWRSVGRLYEGEIFKGTGSNVLKTLGSLGQEGWVIESMEKQTKTHILECYPFGHNRDKRHKHKSTEDYFQLNLKRFVSDPEGVTTRILLEARVEIEGLAE